MRLMPHQQQLQLNNSADRLRELGMPPAKVAADHDSRALNVRAGFRGDELRELPRDQGLGRGVIRSQRNRLYADRHARFSHAHALRVVPRQQQLHIELGGLHGLPPSRLEQHADIRWKRAESHRGGIPVIGFSLRHVPSHHEVG